MDNLHPLKCCKLRSNYWCFLQKRNTHFEKFPSPLLLGLRVGPGDGVQWRSQGLPRWATRRPGGPKWGRKWVKVCGKIRKLNQDLRKKWGKWNSCPPRTVRLATALMELVSFLMKKPSSLYGVPILSYLLRVFVIKGSQLGAFCP